MSNYRKNFAELEKVASKFWSPELSRRESELSVIPILLETQEKFISILSESIDSIENLFVIIDSSDLPPNLFLKHLVILSDFGGEMLKRVSNEFNSLFPRGNLNYYWQGQKRIYQFKTFSQEIEGQINKFSNDTLRIRDKHLVSNKEKNKLSLSSLQKDAIALLLFGSTYYSNEDEQDIFSTLARCEIGSYLGKSTELN